MRVEIWDKDSTPCPLCDAERQHDQRLRERMKTLYADLSSPGPIDAERQRTLAELARAALAGKGRSDA